MKFLLDTNICIYLIRKHPHNVLKKFESCAIGEIGISSITLAELSYGVEKSQHIIQNKKALQEFITPLEVAPFDDQASFHYGKIRAELEKKGVPIGSLDFLIAAHALSLDAKLITNNTKEFARIKKLKLENWV